MEVQYSYIASRMYYLKDHLGDIRVTIDENGVVKGYDDYYPFGLQMPGRSNNFSNPNHLYKYSSKELDKELNLDWYYFGARYYDPGIGRFMTPDPLSFLSMDVTPYHYCHNNPINFIDLNGLIDAADSTKSPYLDFIYPPERTVFYKINNDAQKSNLGSAGGSSTEAPAGTEPMLKTFNYATTIAGSGSSFQQFQYVREGYWWHPAQYRYYPIGKFSKSMIRPTILLQANSFAIASYFLFGINTYLSMQQLKYSLDHGDIVGTMWTGIDYAVSIPMTFGGPLGLGIGAFYFFVYKPIGIWSIENFPQETWTAPTLWK